MAAGVHIDIIDTGPGLSPAAYERLFEPHEIANDDVGGLGLALTYCPLTGTAIAFERARTEFGVSPRRR